MEVESKMKHFLHRRSDFFKSRKKRKFNSYEEAFWTWRTIPYPSSSFSSSLSIKVSLQGHHNSIPIEPSNFFGYSRYFSFLSVSSIPIPFSFVPSFTLSYPPSFSFRFQGSSFFPQPLLLKKKKSNFWAITLGLCCEIPRCEPWFHFPTTTRQDESNRNRMPLFKKVSDWQNDERFEWESKSGKIGLGRRREETDRSQSGRGAEGQRDRSDCLSSNESWFQL